MSWPSAVLPLRLALGEEGGESFVRVVGFHEACRGRAVRLRRVGAAASSTMRAARGRGVRTRAPRRSCGARCCIEVRERRGFGVRGDTTCTSPSPCFVGGDRAAGEQQVLGGRLADAIGQQARRGRREHAELHFGLAELRVGRREDRAARRAPAPARRRGTGRARRPGSAPETRASRGSARAATRASPRSGRAGAPRRSRRS